MEIESRSRKPLVAAIELGTTFSGYAFSMKHDWGKVFSNAWSSGYFISCKVPTCLLLKKDFTEPLFGYDAEDKYVDLKQEKCQNDYYLFQRFKTTYDDTEMICKDIAGNPLDAKLVIQQCILCLKEYLCQKVEKMFDGVFNGEDIEYVLTVPAIWGERAILFMREVAVNAGIRDEILRVALEQEAASVYCQYLKFAKGKRDTSSPNLDVLKPGTKYMVVDLGGDTADITVHQKCEDNTMVELLPATVGPWGGNSVDDQVMNFFKELIGDWVLEEFKLKHMQDYVDMKRYFEAKKRSYKPEPGGIIRMAIPQTLVQLCKKIYGDKNFKDVIDKNDVLKNKVKFSSHKLTLDNGVWEGFFKKTINGIVKHIDEIFQEPGAKDVKIVFMVGGFSECLHVQDSIKKHFEQVSVIVPENAALAVLKGSVYLGHIPDAIPRRLLSMYTYGFQTWPEFNEAIHPKEKMVECGKLSRCRDVFFKIFSKGEKIVPGLTKSQVFQAPRNREDIVECGLFVSDKMDPKFVDDPGCKLLGHLHVPFSLNKRNCETLIEETDFSKNIFRIYSRRYIFWIDVLGMLFNFK